MISLTIFNKSQQKTVLLIHGVFASSGFWLPYLGSLKHSRLLMLDIDYCAISDIGPYMLRLEEIILREAGGHVNAVISHSLGAFLASLLPTRMREISYELCPVYGATQLHPETFANDINKRLGYKVTRDQIRSTLVDVGFALARHSPLTLEDKMRDGIIYLPDADPYFSYDPGAAGRTFIGDHFNVTAAMGEIGRELSK